MRDIIIIDSVYVLSPWFYMYTPYLYGCKCIASSFCIIQCVQIHCSCTMMKVHVDGVGNTLCPLW